jgi:uncharacterized membrane protein YfcA
VTWQLVLGLALSAGIGLSLGLLGGGGSILTVPVLIYVLGVEPRAAIAMSLAVVGATSLLSAGLHSRRGTVRWRTAALFAGSGTIAALAGARWSYAVPERWLLLAFATLMVVTSVRLLSGAPGAAGMPTTPGSSPRTAQVIAAGLGVGFLTGFLGVGGGFLIVPALVLFAGLPMREAIGTSLVVIAANCAAGLAAHLAHGGFDPRLTLAVTTLAAAGAFAGTALSHRLPVAALRRGFALFVLAVGLYLAVRNLPL